MTNIGDYLIRLSAFLAPASIKSAAQIDESPLGLAAELDFLDAVWRSKFDKHVRLLALPGAITVSSISADAEGAEQFDARMSALGQILKSFQIPDAAGSHPIQRLAARLWRDLPPESSARVDSAIGMLESAVAIRNGGAHDRAAPDAIAALGRFGVGYPITDWLDAWRSIRSHAASALATIREELQVSIEDT